MLRALRIFKRNVFEHKKNILSNKSVNINNNNNCDKDYRNNLIFFNYKQLNLLIC